MEAPTDTRDSIRRVSNVTDWYYSLISWPIDGSTFPAVIVYCIGPAILSSKYDVLNINITEDESLVNRLHEKGKLF